LINVAGDQYVLGVDFGTDTVRALLVNAANGAAVSSFVFAYPRWAKGLYCDPARNRFRQHPLDYIEGLEAAVKGCLHFAGPEKSAHVKGLSIGTTGSTPAAVGADGVPLALTAGFEDNPNAMFVLWKDHTALREAAELNLHAKGTSYLKYAGGIYSPEWYWAKLLHVLREDPQVAAAGYSWVEHCDWLPFLLTGERHAGLIRRSRCAAGHKALWDGERGDYPPCHFFASLDVRLGAFAARLPRVTYTAGQRAGLLSRQWARRLGLPDKVVVGIGALDTHMAAAGGQIEPYYLTKIMGARACDILVVPSKKEEIIVNGTCSQAGGSVIPGMTAYEAMQSGPGDSCTGLRGLLEWPLGFISDPILKAGLSGKLRYELNRQAADLPLEENAEMAINLASGAPRIFRALAETSCFDTRALTDRFTAAGIPVKGLTVTGGAEQSSPYRLQLLADILQMPVRFCRTEQACALGAAMFAATAAGIYPDIHTAMGAMGQGFDRFYIPERSRAGFYDRRYQKYQVLGHFTEMEPV